MFGSFGWMELLLILIIVLIVFGAGKLPQLGEGIGKAIQGFKKSVNEPEPMERASVPEAESSPRLREVPEAKIQQVANAPEALPGHPSPPPQSQA